MPRYRVQGPDGAIHVFEGPEGASPAEVQAFASKTFGQSKAPAAPDAGIAPDDPGVAGSMLIGAGRATDRIAKGVQQLYYGAKQYVDSPDVTSLVTGRNASQRKLDELRANAAEDDRLYKPLQDQHGIATAIGEALPSLAVPAGGAATMAGTVGRLALAGAAPGALEYGTAGERAGRAAMGAAGGVVGGVVAPKIIQAGIQAVPAIGKTAKAIIEPLYEGGRKAIAGRTLNMAAGDAAPAVAQRLSGAAQLLPGSAPTAAQVAESGGIAALERSVSAANPEAYAKRGMDQAAARLQALRGIAGDDAAMSAAKATRQAQAKPLYDAAATQTVDVDANLTRFLSRPSVQKAMARAEKIAEEEGRQFGMTRATKAAETAGTDAAGAPVINFVPAQPGKITGQTLQDIKMGLDALLKDPTSGIAGKEASLVESTRGQLMGWMEKQIPGLGQARETYAKLSAPVNQMQVGKELLQRIEPALADHGALGREAGNKYALALRNGDQTAVKATKFKGAGMADVMTPAQMDTINAVGQDLARKANAQDLGRGGGSDTFQKLAMSNIAARSGAPRVMNAVLDAPGVSKVGKFMYSGPEEKIQSLLAQALLDPQMAGQLMAKNVTPQQRALQQLFANPSRATQLIGGTSGIALGHGAAQ